MERTITLEEKSMNVFNHFASDLAGFGLIGTILLTIPVQEIGIIVPIISGVVMMFGQGVRWYRDDQRKQQRHHLFLDIASKMAEGKIPLDKEFLDRLDND